MIRRPPVPTLTDSICPYPPLCRPGLPFIMTAARVLRGHGSGKGCGRERGNDKTRLHGEIPRLKSWETRAGEPGAHRAFQTRNSGGSGRSEEHTSELQSLMRHSYAGFCVKKHNEEVSGYKLYC